MDLDIVVEEFCERGDLDPPWTYDDEDMLKLLLRMKAVFVINDSDIKEYCDNHDIKISKRINRTNPHDA